MCVMLPVTTFAGCLINKLNGTNQAWAVTNTFVAGEPFDRIGEVRVGVMLTLKDGSEYAPQMLNGC